VLSVESYLNKILSPDVKHSFGLQVQISGCFSYAFVSVLGEVLCSALFCFLLF